MNNNLELFKTPESKSSYELRKGDVMQSMGLGQVYFEEWKRGMQSYVCVQISTGKRYKTRVSNAYDEKFTIIGSYKIETAKDKFGDDSQNMVKGDLFIIDKGKKACEMFRFVDYGKTGKINASLPMDETKVWSIDKSFTCIKVAKLI